MAKPASEFLVSAVRVSPSQISDDRAFIEVTVRGELTGLLHVNKEDGDALAKRLLGGKCLIEHGSNETLYYPPDAEKPTV